MVSRETGNMFTVKILQSTTVERLRCTFVVLQKSLLRLLRKYRGYSVKNYFKWYYISNPGKYSIILEAHPRIYLLCASKAPTICSAAFSHGCRRDSCWLAPLYRLYCRKQYATSAYWFSLLREIIFLHDYTMTVFCSPCQWSTVWEVLFNFRHVTVCMTTVRSRIINKPKRYLYFSLKFSIWILCTKQNHFSLVAEKQYVFRKTASKMLETFVMTGELYEEVNPI